MLLTLMWQLLNQRIDAIQTRVEILEARETASTFDAAAQLTLADAVALDPESVSIRYISDGLREGGGVGVLAYFDIGSSDWRRISDNVVVTT